MNDESVSHDATASTKAILYQFYVAVLKCYEMLAGQKLLIERQGDVTIKDVQQVETKAYSAPLNDTHPNFWKTLYNWMKDDFDPAPYSSLILLTTQQFGPKSTLARWNESSPNERLKILREISEKTEARASKSESGSPEDKLRPSRTLKHQRFILDRSRSGKLSDVLAKFFIEAQSPRLPSLYEQIQQKYIKGVLHSKRADFLNVLAGFVMRPEASNAEKWEISFEDFDRKVGELNTTYCKETLVFPRKHLDAKKSADGEEIDRAERHAFTRKIRDIDYREVIREAIHDYLGAMQTVNDEFRAYRVHETRTERFIEELTRIFSARFRTASRNCREVIRDSQNFYDAICAEEPPTFEGFQTPPRAFRNGLLHAQMNERTDLEWRLGKR